MLSMTKRFNQACENNKRPILQQLQRLLSSRKMLLEIGSGTGQHAAFFAEHLPHLIWQTSDMPVNHDSICAWLADNPAENQRAPLAFTIGIDAWPEGHFDAVYTANTAHIMQPDEVQLMMAMVQEYLPKGGLFCQYGPFNIAGQYTSEGNAKFDQHLANEGCGGIRDIDELKAWAPKLQLQQQIAMPANNFLLVWRK